MRVLVTGGAGYIGSHAVRQLVGERHEVVVLDDLRHGYREAVDQDADLIVGNIGDEALVARLCREFAIETVMHFAAFIEVSESVADPDKYYRNNFVNSLSLLRALRAEGVKRFVLSSTAAVYGNPIQVPIDETHPRQPVNPYGRSKLMIEMALEDFGAAYGLGYVILRCFNVAGAAPDGTIGEAHNPETHLIPRILAAARDEASAVSIYGTDYQTADGTCIRDYVHVEDLARAHVLALARTRSAQPTVYNLGSENGHSVREVIAACQKVTGHKIKVIECDRRPGDPAVLIAGSAKIREDLGWKPRYPELETMIRHAWNWHSKSPHGYRSLRYHSPDATSIQ